MFGTWRWILAISVVHAHLYGPWWPGPYAVFSFYLISGFLMTLIMNENYGYTWSGFKSFWANRVLRLYPPYYLACLLSLFVIWFMPEPVNSDFTQRMTVPDTPGEIFANVSMFGLTHSYQLSSLVPIGWTLAIEIFYYAVISVWAGRSKRNGYIFLTASLLFLAYNFIFDNGRFGPRYFQIPGGSLPFSMGVCLYFNRNALKDWLSRFRFNRLFMVAGVGYLGVYALASRDDAWHIVWLYVSLIASGLVLILLWMMPASSRFRKIDRFLGDLSYPTYLMHIQIGTLVASVSGHPFKGPFVFCVSFVLLTLASIIETRTVSGSIQEYRQRIKNRAGRVGEAATP